MDGGLFLAVCTGVLIAGMFIGADVWKAGFNSRFQCTESAIVGNEAECVKYERVQR